MKFRIIQKRTRKKQTPEEIDRSWRIQNAPNYGVSLQAISLLQEQGYSVKEIAAKMDLSKSAVILYMRKYGSRAASTILRT